MSDEWYCQTLGHELGPMLLADLAHLVRQGHVVGADKVRLGSDGHWTPAAEVSEFSSLIADRASPSAAGDSGAAAAAPFAAAATFSAPEPGPSRLPPPLPPPPLPPPPLPPPLPTGDAAETPTAETPTAASFALSPESFGYGSNAANPSSVLTTAAPNPPVEHSKAFWMGAVCSVGAIVAGVTVIVVALQPPRRTAHVSSMPAAAPATSVTPATAQAPSGPAGGPTLPAANGQATAPKPTSAAAAGPSAPSIPAASNPPPTSSGPVPTVTNSEKPKPMRSNAPPSPVAPPTAEPPKVAPAEPRTSARNDSARPGDSPADSEQRGANKTPPAQPAETSQAASESTTQTGANAPSAPTVPRGDDSKPVDAAKPPAAPNVPVAGNTGAAPAMPPRPTTPQVNRATGAVQASASASSNPGTPGLPAVAHVSMSLEERCKKLEELGKQWVARQTDAFEIIGDGKKLQEKMKSLDSQLASINSDAASVQVALASMVTGIDPDLAGQLNGEYAALMQSAAKVELEREQVAAKYEQLVKELAKIDEQIDALRSEFLEVADIFGFMAHENLEAALPLLEAWINIDLRNPTGHLARGFAYWQAGKLDKALEDMNAAVKMGGSMKAACLAARGAVLNAMGRKKEGMADFGQALKVNKGESLIYLFRGRVACRNENFGAAVKDFGAAVRLKPKDPETYRHLALVQATCPQDRFRNGKKAMDNAKKACELTKWSNWRCLEVMAAACAEAGDFDQAAKWETKASEFVLGGLHDECRRRIKLYEEKKALRLDWSNL